MAPRNVCRHERAHFHSIQRLGKLPPLELWQCPVCKSTIAKESLMLRPDSKTAAA